MLDIGRLQLQLRRAVLARISSGQMSGSRLARITGFKQPHITNFLHGKRGLSVEGMDRVLKALEMSALDLVPARELERFVHAGSDTEYEAIPLVDADALQLPLPPASAIQDWVKLKRTMLGRLRAQTMGKREHWLRFVLMRVADEDAEAMYPTLRRRATLLVDRHCNSIEARQAGEMNVYVVRGRERIMVRWLETVGSQIIMRPEKSSVPLEFIAIDKKNRFAEKVIGRVCWEGSEM